MSEEDMLIDNYIELYEKRKIKKNNRKNFYDVISCIVSEMKLNEIDILSDKPSNDGIYGKNCLCYLLDVFTPLSIHGIASLLKLTKLDVIDAILQVQSYPVTSSWRYGEVQKCILKLKGE